jgi:hypothetical protein
MSSGSWVAAHLFAMVGFILQESSDATAIATDATARPSGPAPPPSGGALAWLRWTIAVLKAGTGRNRAAIRRHLAPAGGSESLGTVAVAIGTDLAMSVPRRSRPR